MWKKRILLVDNEPSFTRMVKIHLEKAGAYEVREENIGPEALATARQFNPDLILLDVIMPDMNGGDVALEIEADKDLKNIPIVFLTGSAPEKSGYSRWKGEKPPTYSDSRKLLAAALLVAPG